MIDLNGRVVASTKEGIFVGTGGPRAAYLDTSLEPGQTDTSWTLKALHRDGTVEVLEHFGTKEPRGLVLSPDGKFWLWTSVMFPYQNRATTHSELHLASSGGIDRVIATYDPPGFSSEIVQAYRWDAGGVIVSHGEQSTGSYDPLGHGALGDTFLLDPVARTMMPISEYEYSGAGQCNLEARAPDGTLACITQYPNPTAEQWRSELRIREASNPPMVIQLGSTHMWFGAGAVSFAPGIKPTKLVLGEWNGAMRKVTGPVNPWYITDCRTDLVDLTTGLLRSPFGDEGLCPPDGGWAWIDLLNVIAFSPAMASTYVTSPTGVSRRLATGIPVGILRG